MCLLTEQNKERLRLLHETLAPTRLTRIVDVGASPVNPAPYEMLLNEGFAEVIGFEPQPEPFADLQSNPVKNRTVLPYAVGDGKNGTLHVCAASGFTSLLEPNTDFWNYAGRWRRVMRVLERLPIETKRLDDIQEIDAFDMLKIDIQGGEVGVFENGLKKIANALVVYTEVAYIPIYRDQPLLDAQMRTLRPLDFALHKLVSMTKIMLATPYSKHLRPRHHRNQPIDGDAVFIRYLLELDKHTEEDLKHLAILADSVFHSYDLVLHILAARVEAGTTAPEAVSAYISMLPATVPQ